VVVPNGVDVDAFPWAPVAEGHTIVFTGSLDYLPNVDGLAWFCGDVLPAIRARVPDATLDIVGRNPVDDVVALSRLPGVMLHRDVASVVPHLHQARVAVVPLRLGSGTRLKALEAMAAGVALVGTAVGLEGLAIGSGRHALVADSPEAFADSAVRLLTNDGDASELAAAARRLVEERYRWDVIGERFADLVLFPPRPGRASSSARP
jgi:glycosyltransferase involved in cell wall biosynthesis